MKKTIRCPWAEKSELEKAYHDTEWGIPVHDDKTLFKMLILEGQQAGLSWATILKKRESLCAAFDGFDPALVKDYDNKKIEALLHTDGIIKNRLPLPTRRLILHSAKNSARLMPICGAMLVTSPVSMRGRRLTRCLQKRNCPM